MAKITFYTTGGRQVDPKGATSSAPPDPIGDIIDYEIEFYIDFERLFVASLIFSESSAAGGRGSDSFYVVFQGDSRDTLIEDFTSTLTHIEKGEIPTDHSWKFPHEDTRYELPWLAIEQADNDLIDLGLTYAQQLAVQRLLEEGTKLDIGVIDWEAAAIAVMFASKYTDSNNEMAVSKRGRESVLSDIPIVIEPNRDANFLPLTDATALSFQNKKENLKETIKRECRTLFDEKLQDLTNCPIEEKESVLLSLKNYLDEDNISSVRSDIDDIVSSQSVEIYDTLINIFDTVSDGGVVKEKYDTKSLDSDERTELLTSFEDMIENQISDIEPKVDYNERLEELVDNTSTFPRENRYILLGKILELAKGNLNNINNESLEEFELVYNKMLNSKLLESTEKEDIKQNLITRAKNLQNECERREKEDIESNLATARASITEKSLTEQRELVNAILSEFSTINKNNKKGTHLPRNYKDCLNNLENSKILDQNILSNIRSSERKTLEELESEIEEKLYTQQRDEIKNKIETKRINIETTNKEIELLQGVRRLLAVPSNDVQWPDDLEYKLKIKLDQIEESVEETYEMEISDSDALFSELDNHCQSEIDKLREIKKENAKESKITEIKSEIQALPVEKKLEKLSKYKSNLKQIRWKSDVVNDNIEIIKDALGDIDSTFNDGYTITEDNIQDLIDDIINGIESFEENHIEQYKERLENNFNESIQKIRRIDYTDEEILFVLRESEARLKGGDGSSVNEEKYTSKTIDHTEDPIFDGLVEALKVLDSDSDSNLPESEQKELRNELKPKINDKIDEITEEKKEVLVDDITQYIKQDILPAEPFESNTVNQLMESLSAINNIKGYSNSQNLSTNILNKKSNWWDLLPDNKQNSAQEELYQKIEIWEADLEDALDDAALSLHEQLLDDIKEIDDELDKLVALKEFKNLLNGTRSEWPRGVAEQATVDFKEIDLDADTSNLIEEVATLIDDAKKKYINQMRTDIDDSLEELRDNNDINYSSFDPLKNKIDDPMHQYEGDPVPFESDIDRMHSELGKFGSNDEVYNDITDKLKHIVKKHKDKMPMEEDTDTGSITQKLIHSSPVSTKLIPTFNEGNSNSASEKERLLQMPSFLSGSLAVFNTFLLILVVSLLILGASIVMNYPGGGEETPSSDSPSGNVDPDMTFDSLSFIGTAVINGPTNYSVEYSLSNVSESGIHQIKFSQVRDVSRSKITATDSNGNTVPTEHITSQPSGVNQGNNSYIIEYLLNPSEDKNHSDITVSLEGQITTLNETEPTDEKVSVNVLRSEQPPLKKSTTITLQS